jgi:hypothetical protein
MFGNGYLERQNELLTAQLAEALRVSQAMNERLTSALDHVLKSKFDAPLMPQPTEQPKREPLPDLGYVLSVEDDTEFLERTSQ